MAKMIQKYAKMALLLICVLRGCRILGGIKFPCLRQEILFVKDGLYVGGGSIPPPTAA